MDPLQNQSQPIIQQQPVNQPPPPQQQAPSASFVNTSILNSSSKKPFLKIFIIIFFVLIVLALTAIIMFAYGTISIGSQELRDKIAGVIMRIPFAPKTSRFVLLTAADLHQELTRMSIDASLATSSPSFGSIFGSGNIDVQAKGSFDYTNPDNLTAAFNVKITKDFDVDIKALDQKVYFKINSFPSLIAVMLSSFGIPEDSFKEISNKWFYYDLTSLNAEAHQNLREQQKKFDMTSSSQILQKILNNKDIAKSITLKTENLDGVSTYHIIFKPTDEALDALWKTYQNSSSENISKSIKNFTLDAWIGEKDYYVRKMSIGLAYKSPSASYSLPSINSMGLPLSQQEVPISFVIKFADFGKEVPVTAPENPIKFEDLIKTIMASYATKSAQISPTKTLVN